jgi:hypothetical protein
MKTQLLSTVLVSIAILAGSFAYSNDAKPVNTLTKEIAIKSAFQKITLESGIDLVLVQGANRSTILITGEENLVESVNVSIEKGVLSISSKKSLRNKKIKIYVPVTTLSSLDLASYASVTTEGIVKLKGLKVLVHEGSKVSLNILGDFHIESGDDCDFVYEKYEVAKVVYIRQ